MKTSLYNIKNTLLDDQTDAQITFIYFQDLLVPYTIAIYDFLFYFKHFYFNHFFVLKNCPFHWKILLYGEC